MKQFFVYFFALFLVITSIVSSLPNPLISIVLMVKNEEAAIPTTLQPFIDAGINSYLILDTGSTDSTIKITQDLFTTHTITQGYIIEQPFIDFATSRNYALQCAEEKFPNSAFFLMIDAEWITHNVPDLIQFCKDHIKDEAHSYLVSIKCENNSFFVQRLIRPHKNLRYEGIVHEYFNHPTDCQLPETIFFSLKMSHYGLNKSKQRWLRDRQLLHKMLENDPYNGHTLYYLGQTYYALDDFDNAILYYEKYCAIAKPDEFNFMVTWQLGELYQQKNNWSKALYYYLNAYNIRPTRAEPLTKIADHYLHAEQFTTSFLFAQKTCSMPYPKNDIFLIDKNIYEYARYDILCKAALCIGNIEIGTQALHQALKTQPNNPQLKHILNLYQKETHDC